MATGANLSTHDQIILESIFNPNLPFDEEHSIDNNSNTAAIGKSSSMIRLPIPFLSTPASRSPTYSGYPQPATS